MPPPFAIPVGLNPTAIGVEAVWWLEAARRAEDAGFETVWMWDHFISRGSQPAWHRIGFPNRGVHEHDLLAGQKVTILKGLQQKLSFGRTLAWFRTTGSS